MKKMKQSKSYKFRIYPNVKQKILLAKSFGCSRFMWNYLVECFNKKEKDVKSTTEMRQEKEWMKEVSAGILQQKVRDFVATKNQFFNKKRKKKIGAPQFKNKFMKQSCRFPDKKFLINQETNKVRLEKLGWIKTNFDRVILSSNKLISCTVSKNSADEYYVSICTEEEILPLPKTNKSVGVDVGIKSFAVTSDAIEFPNPRYFIKSQDKIAKMQRHLAKKIKGSSRHKSCKQKLAKLHSKVANQRSWYLHNLTTWLVKNYDLIALEDLNVAGMLKNRKLAKAISDVSWGEFFRQLTYKAKWFGKEVVQVDRFYASSKTCSCCGWKNKNLTLKDRTFVCQECGVVIDRDYNAAINILNKVVGVDTTQQTSRDVSRSLVSTSVEILARDILLENVDNVNH